MLRVGTIQGHLPLYRYLLRPALALLCKSPFLLSFPPPPLLSRDPESSAMRSPSLPFVSHPTGPFAYTQKCLMRWYDPPARHVRRFYQQARVAATGKCQANQKCQNDSTHRYTNAPPKSPRLCRPSFAWLTSCLPAMYPPAWLL